MKDWDTQSDLWYYNIRFDSSFRCHDMLLMNGNYEIVRPTNQKKNYPLIETGCYIWYQSIPNKMLSIGLKKLEIMWLKDSNRF